MATVGPIVPGIPGFRAAVTSAYRRVSVDGAMLFAALDRLIDGTKSRDPLNTGDVDRLEAGLLMGIVTATGKYAPSILGLTTGTNAQNGTAYTSGGTSIAVAPATAVEIARRIGSSGTLTYVGPPSAAGTVAVLSSISFSAINTSTGVITTSTLGANLVNGSLVCDTDGSHVPVTVIPDGYPVVVTDETATSIDVMFKRIPIGGFLDTTKILNYPADSSTKTWVRTNLSTVSGGKFTFSDVF